MWHRLFRKSTKSKSDTEHDITQKLQRPNSHIFCIGLSRTGTTSLSKALGILGYDIVHFPCDATTIRQLKSGDYNLEILHSKDGISDIVAAAYYKEFYQLFPTSKFILTVREKTNWLSSYKSLLDDHKHDWFQNKFVQFMSTVVYGTYHYDEKRLSNAFDQHLKEVEAFFANKNASLLTINICSGEGWEKLCPFLGCAQPPVRFPWLNVAHSKPWEEFKGTRG